MPELLHYINCVYHFYNSRFYCSDSKHCWNSFLSCLFLLTCLNVESNLNFFVRSYLVKHKMTTLHLWIISQVCIDILVFVPGLWYQIFISAWKKRINSFLNYFLKHIVFLYFWLINKSKLIWISWGCSSKSAFVEFLSLLHLWHLWKQDSLVISISSQ